MVISLDPELEKTLHSLARQQGIDPETLVIKTLRERFQAAVPRIEPRDDWERGLLALATDCGVSLSNEAVSSEGLYD